MEVAFLGALLSAVGFGIANVVIKKVLENTSIPQTLTMSIISGMFFVLLLNLIQGFPGNVSTELILTLAIFAFGEVALYLSLYKAFDAANVTVASGIIATYPVLSTLFAILFLQETIAVIKILYIVLIVVGAILIGIDWSKVKKDGFDKNDLVKGLPYALLSLLLHAVYFPALGGLTASGNWEFKLLGIKVFAVIILFVVFFVLKKNRIQMGNNRLKLIALLGLLEVIGWVGISWASDFSTGIIALIIAVGSSAPLVTAILARIFLNERLNKLQYLGILIVVASLTLIALP